ncbi:MAG: polysaccharide deacetylase family protein [Bacteroidetes bacterium]|nr:polysaccharide deacetylase family protein [Bacteroidota bacterium]
MFTPYRVPSLLKRLYPGLVWDIPVKDKHIFLTFDDGPHPVATPWVLETLAPFQAKATFFCVGENVSRYPEIAEQLKSAGHSIGNHTYNHLKGWNVPDQEYLVNTRKAGENTSNKLFRPPYGRIRRSQAKMLQEDGFRIIMWSLLSCDYLQKLNREQSLNTLCRCSKPGSLVVFHDSARALENMQWILPRYLQEMHDRGFTFAAL